MDAISGFFGLIGIIISLVVLVLFYFACMDINRIKRESKYQSQVLETINKNLGTIIHYLKQE